MRCVRSRFIISLYVNQEIYPLNKLIILDLDLNVNMVNQRSLLNWYRNAILGEYIWAEDSKALVRGYGNVFIIIIVSSEGNKFSDPIIKIIRIPNITFYLSFVYNIMLF